MSKSHFEIKPNECLDALGETINMAIGDRYGFGLIVFSLIEDIKKPISLSFAASHEKEAMIFILEGQLKSLKESLKEELNQEPN